MSGFQKAQRFLTNPTIALTGPTGSGKTFSALKLATGISKIMNGRIAVIDTENGSASLYSELFDFDTLNITPPFTTDKYIQAIKLAEMKGYCAVICDSITHAWAGEGGLLEQKAQLDARPGSNHWTNWGPIKIKDQKFRNAYLHSSIPFFIATMRSKMEYAQTENNGKKKVEKQGMAPVQSEGVEYEFSLVLDVAMNHEAEVSKDRTHLFDKQKIFQITEQTGEMLVYWREGGKKREAVKAAQAAPPQYENEPQQFPEDDLDSYLGPQGSHPPGSFEAAADYVVTFGKYKGKKIREISPVDIRGFCSWLKVKAAEDQRIIDPEGPVGIFIDQAYIYIEGLR